MGNNERKRHSGFTCTRVRLEDDQASEAVGIKVNRDRGARPFGMPYLEVLAPAKHLRGADELMRLVPLRFLLLCLGPKVGKRCAAPQNSCCGRGAAR